MSSDSNNNSNNNGGKCNNCIDRFHEMMGHNITKYNHMGDVFVFLNIALFLYVLGSGGVITSIMMSVFKIGFVLYIIRAIIASITICDADTNREFRPWTSTDNLWYIISGHTLNAMLITYIILNSQTTELVKYMSILFCILVMFFQSASREHYTVDIILTILIVHLALKAYMVT